MSKVVQMIPAAGWTAAFRDEETHTKGDSRSLVCWALMEDGRVEGLVVNDCAIVPVTSLGNFMSYHCYVAHGSGIS